MDKSSQTIVIDSFLSRVPSILVLTLIIANIFFVLIADELENLPDLAEYLFEQLDLAGEVNGATWCSVALLLANSLLAYVHARRCWPAQARVAAAYGCLAIGFLFLSIDDFVMIHEEVEENVIEPLVAQLPERGQAMYDGLLFGAILALLLVVIVSGPIFRTVRRGSVALLVASVALVIAGVIAEFVFVQLECDYRSRCFRVEVVFEEGGEMLAILAFLSFQYRQLNSAVTQARE
ncbi:MAG: hypothetical protein HY315_05805 [Acidobacteria bacterium]|nr:hypothetical protein [Acidobacteriota bacterium]